MERRLYGRRRLEKVHCDAKRKHKATLPELAKHWRISRSSWDRSGGPYTGEREVSDFLMWNREWTPFSSSWRRSRCEGEGGDDTWRLPTGTCSPLSNSPRGETNSSSRRSSWRQGPEEWGSKKPMKVQELHLGSGGGTTGPQGDVSESLSMGLGLEYHWAPLTGTF